MKTAKRNFKNKQNNYSTKNNYGDISRLLQRIEEEKPNKGEYLYDYKLSSLKEQISQMSAEEINKKIKIDFKDLPISKNTLNGLKKQNFHRMTEIQRCVLPHSISHRDILGASKTGSGKTLCYLITILENLFLKQWTPLDGIGAIVIVPIRELARQVYEVLQSISSFHNFSYGILIGGNNVDSEKGVIDRLNILICTPGRLLQHMNESFNFDPSNLQILVLDEIDMLMELGFQNSMKNILKNLSQQRQTLLFSATLSKDVTLISQLSLKDPENILLHVQNKDPNFKFNSFTDIFETPLKLQQYVMIMELEDKLDNLYSFIRAHQKSKILIFFSSCKQCRFAYETFKMLRIGLPLFELHGRMKQPKRTAIFLTFCEKNNVALFTTNIASRGLDFPKIDWIIQVDCPEDVQTYIHRIGRTARYNSIGKALLFLTQQEIKFLDRLEERHIKIQNIKANPKKTMTIKSTLQCYNSEDIKLKYLAQRAFISYMRSIFLSKDKEVFDVSKIDSQKFAESLGLIQYPIIKFKQLEDQKENTKEIKIKKNKLMKFKEKIEKQKRAKMNQEKNNEVYQNDQLYRNKGCNEEIEQNIQQLENKDQDKDKNISKIEQLRKRKNMDVYSNHFQRMREQNNLPNENEFLVKKQANEKNELFSKIKQNFSNRSLKRIKPEGIQQGKNKIIFDQIGNKYTQEQYQLLKYKQNEKLIQNEDLSKQYRRKLILNKDIDEQNEKERVQQKRFKKKQKFKQQKQQENGVAVIIGDPQSDEINNN